jgi:hypothetical protein
MDPLTARSMERLYPADRYVILVPGWTLGRRGASRGYNSGVIAFNVVEVFLAELHKGFQ